MNRGLNAISWYCYALKTLTSWGNSLGVIWLSKLYHCKWLLHTLTYVTQIMGCIKFKNNLGISSVSTVVCARYVSFYSYLVNTPRMDSSSYSRRHPLMPYVLSLDISIQHGQFCQHNDGTCNRSIMTKICFWNHACSGCK